MGALDRSNGRWNSLRLLDDLDLCVRKQLVSGSKLVSCVRKGYLFMSATASSTAMQAMQPQQLQLRP